MDQFNGSVQFLGEAHSYCVGSGQAWEKNVGKFITFLQYYNGWKVKTISGSNSKRNLLLCLTDKKSMRYLFTNSNLVIYRDGLISAPLLFLRAELKELEEQQQQQQKIPKNSKSGVIFSEF